MRRRNARSVDREMRWEQLEPRELLAVTGDAPAPYPAASVSPSTGPVIGVSRSVDDGVAFGLLRTGMLDAEVAVEVTNVGVGGAQFDAWIDFDQDGSFSGAAEQILDSLPLANGTHLLAFDIPATALDGETWARFRISTGTTGAGLGQGGTAINGEVEDYPVMINPPFITTAEFGSARLITNNGTADGVVDVLAADVDGDGRMDVVSSSHIDGEIAVYRVDSSFTYWTRTDLQEDVTPSNSTTEVFAVGLAAGDLDGDGDIDLASASATDGTIAWYRNDTVGSTLSFTKFEITDTADGARAVVMADFDRDGRLDLASAALADDVLLVHRNTGGGGSSQFDTTLAFAFPGSSFVADLYAIDVNRDGFVDLVSITAGTNHVRWHENDETPFNGVWTGATSIYNGTDSTGEAQGSGVFATQIDDDVDIDVVATSFGEARVDWFSNSSLGGSWTSRNSIGSGLAGANPPHMADIDGDGDMDVVVPAYDDDELAIYTNNGNGVFALSDTSNFFATPTNVAVADINGDGALDVVAGGNLNDRIQWWPGTLVPSEMLVTGNGLEISDRDYSPSLSDGTDFGVLMLDSVPLERTFAIINTGSGTLLLGDASLPSGFALVAAPAPQVPPSGSTAFTIRVDTAVAGVKSGQVRIANNDFSQNPYDFTIRATVIALLGDYNMDHRVTMADYTLWRDTLGSTVPAYTGADGNGNGVVDAADYAVWKNQFGEVYVPPAGSSSALRPAMIVDTRFSLAGVASPPALLRTAATPRGSLAGVALPTTSDTELLLLDLAFAALAENQQAAPRNSMAAVAESTADQNHGDVDPWLTVGPSPSFFRARLAFV